MKKYTIEVQNCIEVEVEAETAEEARFKLIEDESLWNEKFCRSATIWDPIKEEEL